MLRKSNQLTPNEAQSLIEILQARFDENMHRHDNIKWAQVETKLNSSPAKLWSLNQMELTGGEPDVACYDAITDEFVFCDFSPESPQGRRSLCYDNEALLSRKVNKPRNSALGMANDMGVSLLSEQQYHQLQLKETVDTKTSSWVQTPKEVRELGGALFCDRRYNQVFLYHNGAESYYASRGFRSLLRV